MNLLPFVLVIIALFATLSASLLSKNRAIALEYKAYKSYLDAERSAQRSIVKSAYAKIPVPKKPSEPSQERSKKPVKNWRLQPGKQKLARLNIYALLHEDNPPPYLTQTFYLLLDELYATLPLYVEMKKQGRLEAFFNEWKKYQTFDDILYEDENFTVLLYKMRKGCVCYDTEIKKGYPPLEDFMHINPSSASKPMPWRLARPPLLRAYFGPLASKILSIEAENPYSQATLSRDELMPLMQFYPEIPPSLLSDTVGNQSDPESIGISDLTQVKRTLN